MDFSLAEEQQQLRESAGDYLAARYPLSRLAEIADGTHGSVAGSWPELVELGWLDSAVGGVERAILAEQAGYHLLPAPWWTTVALATPFLRQQKISLDQPATYADGAGGAETDKPVRATDGQDGWRLTGTVSLVAEAGPACILVVRAVTDTGPAVFTVAADVSGVQVTELGTHDSLRPMARIDFADAPATLLADVAAAAALTHTADAWAGAMLAAEAVGVAARALDLAVDHARNREQFGRPIGSFQAVAHQLADCYVRIESARSLAYRAGHLLDTDNDQAEIHCAVATAVVAGRDAAVGSCQTALQVTGGLGMTWEYPLHRWLRRALWLSAYQVGTQPHEAIAAQLLDDPAQL